MLKKLSVLVLSLAMVGLYTPFAGAQSISEAELRAAGLTDAEIALFMSLLGGTTTTTVSSNRGCDADYLRDLGMGATGADVQNLQQFLNDAGFAVSASGAGSVGMESMYYGSLTAGAVTRFQNAYAAEVLAPLGLTAGTGYFGAASRAKVRELCAGMVVNPAPTPDNGGDDDDDDDSDSDGLRGGEASLEEYDIKSEEDVNENDMAHVATVEFDVEDGDVRVDRLDLSFVPSSTPTEDDPWDAFETITLMVDGEELAEEDVDDQDEWLDDDTDNTTADPYVFRMSNLDWVVREGDSVEVEIYLTAQNGVDDAGTDASWTIFVNAEGIRAVDSEGIQNYTGSLTDTVTFDIDAEGGDEELKIRSSSNDPDASTIAVDLNSNSSWYSIFVHDVEAEENDIDLENLGEYTVTVGTEVYTDLINDVRLVIDGEEFDDVTVTDGGTTTADLTFDIDKDFTVDADERVEVEFQVRFNKLTGNYAEGETVQVSVTGNSTDFTGEGADDVAGTGTATGETHTLRSEGIYATNFSSSSTKTENASGETNSVTWMIEFDVTAFEDDAYIPQTVNRGTSATAGITYQIEDSANNVAAANDTDTTESFSSEADVAGSYFLVREGETESFTLSVTITDDATADVETPGFVRVQLLEMNFNDSQAAADTQYDFAPANDYDTSVVNLQT